MEDLLYGLVKGVDSSVIICVSVGCCVVMWSSVFDSVCTSLVECIAIFLRVGDWFVGCIFISDRIDCNVLFIFCSMEDSCVSSILFMLLLMAACSSLI
jgi:hypothetical protein